MKKIIALIRTSTDKQDRESQKKEVIETIITDGYEEENIIVIGDEEGASAIKVDEQYLKNLNKVYNLIEEGEIEAVYAWAIDRIGRTRTHLNDFREFLVKHKVQLVIRNPSLKLLENGVENRGVALAFALFAEMAVQEMEHKKERFQRGRKRNAEQGRYNGGYITYGYKIDDKGYYVSFEEEANIVRTIFELMASDKYSLTTLTEEVRSRGIMFHGRLINYQMVLGILKNTAYIGYRDKYVFHHKYPPIISEGLYNKVQEVMRNNNTTKPKASKHFHFGALLIKCPECGRSYVANISKENYRCSAHSAPKIRKAMGEELCGNDLTIHLGHLDGVLWSIATNKHFNYLQGLNEDKKTEIQDQINLLELKKLESPKQLKEIEERYENLDYSFNKKGSRMTKETYDKFFAEIEADEKRITNEIASYDEEISRLNNLLKVDDSRERWFSNFFQITEMKGEENEKMMYDLVHQYIKEVKLERNTMQENLFFGIYKLDGRKSVKITVICVDNEEITLYFIPNLKHIENKVVIINGSEVEAFPYEVIKRKGNVYATTDSIQLTKAFIAEFGNIIRENYNNRKEIFNKTLTALQNDEIDNMLNEIYKKIQNKNNPILLENTIDAVRKYYEID